MPIFRTERLRGAGALRFDAGEKIERLLHRSVAAAAGGLLAKADERGADDPLQLGVLLNVEAQAEMLERGAEEARVELGVELGHFREAGGGFLARVVVFGVGARGVILQDADGVGDISLLDQFADVGLHVARRDAPRLAGEKHGAFAAFRYGGPELAIENFAVRLDDHARVAHFFFVRAEEFAKRFDFGVEAIEHLADGVDLDVALFVAINREANGEMFGELYERGLIGLGVGRVRRRFRRARLSACLARGRGAVTFARGMLRLRPCRCLHRR